MPNNNPLTPQEKALCSISDFWDQFAKYDQSFNTKYRELITNRATKTQSYNSLLQAIRETTLSSDKPQYKFFTLNKLKAIEKRFFNWCFEPAGRADHNYQNISELVITNVTSNILKARRQLLGQNIQTMSDEEKAQITTYVNNLIHGIEIANTYVNECIRKENGVQLTDDKQKNLNLTEEQQLVIEECIENRIQLSYLILTATAFSNLETLKPTDRNLSTEYLEDKLGKLLNASPKPVAEPQEDVDASNHEVNPNIRALLFQRILDYKINKIEKKINDYIKYNEDLKQLIDSRKETIAKLEQPETFVAKIQILARNFIAKIFGWAFNIKNNKELIEQLKKENENASALHAEAESMVKGLEKTIEAFKLNDSKVQQEETPKQQADRRVIFHKDMYTQYQSCLKKECDIQKQAKLFRGRNF